MIGLISGDIIASPFNKVPTEDYNSIFFPIFSSVERISVDKEKLRVSSLSYKPSMTLPSRLALAAADWYMNTDLRNGVDFPEYMEKMGVTNSVPTNVLLAVCGPLVELSRSESEARMIVGNLFNTLKGQGDSAVVADVLTEYMWMLKEGKRPTAEQTRAFLAERGIPVVSSPSEMRGVMDGVVKYNSETGKYDLGDGKRPTDPAIYVSAAILALSSGSNWEECVRRAVAMGGDASVTASLTGSLAELCMKVPETISYRALDYLSEDEHQVHNAFGRMLTSTSRSEGPSLEQLNGIMVSVLRIPGVGSIYGVDKPSAELLTAIENAQMTTKAPYKVVSVQDLNALYKDVMVQRDGEGKELAGVFVQNEPPSMRTLWLQGGRLVSSTTRDGVRLHRVNVPLPSKAVRQRVFSEFQAFKKEVNNIRTELEKSVMYDPAEYGGRHLSFPSARYPVVFSDHVDIYENGICRGRCGINEDGLFVVDANAVGYTFHGEGIEGVLNTRGFFPVKGNMKECLEALRFFVLDQGIIPDEEEAKHLEYDDNEAAAIRKKYGSNIDRVREDISLSDTRKELGDLLESFDKKHGTSLSGNVTDDRSLREAVHEAKENLLKPFIVTTDTERQELVKLYAALAKAEAGSSAVKVSTATGRIARWSLHEGEHVGLDMESAKELFSALRKCEANIHILADGSVMRKADLMGDVLSRIRHADGSEVSYDEVVKMKTLMDEYERLGEHSFLPEAVSPVKGLTVELALPQEVLNVREERRTASVQSYREKDINSLSTLQESTSHQGSVFTIGCSKTDVKDFIANLKRHGIEIVCDARDKRVSRYNRDFNEKELEEALNDAGIGYEKFPSLCSSGVGVFPEYVESDETVKASDKAVASRFVKDIEVLRNTLAEGTRFAVMSSEVTIENSRRFLVLGRALAHPEYTPEAYENEQKGLAILQEKLEKAINRGWNRKAEEIHNEIEDYQLAMKYVPVDVEHITSKGYCVSQARLEQRLLNSYATELGLDKSVEEAEKLNKAYGLRYNSVKEKKTSQQVYYARKNARRGR